VSAITEESPCGVGLRVQAVAVEFIDAAGNKVPPNPPLAQKRFIESSTWPHLANAASISGCSRRILFLWYFPDGYTRSREQTQ